MQQLSASLEDCLEAILQLGRTKGAARVRDMAETLAVHKSTVTAALHALSVKGLVNYSPYELVTLTPQGLAVATDVTSKHSGIRAFLTGVLMLEERTAEDNACRMEHAMDPQVVERLGLFADFVGRRPRLAEALRQFRDYARRPGGRRGARGVPAARRGA